MYKQYCLFAAVARSSFVTSLATPGVSSSLLWPKGISHRTGQSCMSAMYTPPFRYAWTRCHAYLAGFGGRLRGPLVPVRWQMQQLPQWDVNQQVWRPKPVMPTRASRRVRNPALLVAPSSGSPSPP